MSIYYSKLNGIEETRKPINVTLKDSGSDMLSRVSLRVSVCPAGEMERRGRWQPFYAIERPVEAEMQLASEIVAGKSTGFIRIHNDICEWKVL